MPLKDYRKEMSTIEKEKMYAVQKIWCLNNSDKVHRIKRRYKLTHKKEIQKYNKEHRLNLKEYYTKYRKEWKKNNKDKVKNQKLKKKYNITLQEFNTFLKNQGNKCGICEGDFIFTSPSFSPCVDHTHKEDKRIRGLLCRKCNSGIGGLNDDIKLLFKALKWIRRKGKTDIPEYSESILKFGRFKKHNLKRDYNITLEQFNGMLFQQSNRCGICERSFTIKVPLNPCVDHNHKTNKIRGLLCGKCNRSIGCLNDNPYIMLNAVKWLKE
jgi:hypothetical protein